MNTQKSPTAPERLLLGLTIALAASQCALEYGKPLTHVTAFTGWNYDFLDNEEHVPIVIPKKASEPPKPQEPQVRKRIETASFIIAPDREIVAEETMDSLPEFIPDENLFSEPEVMIDAPLIFAEINPQFPGGYEALSRFLAQNLKYPREAIENRIEGTVYVQFIVGKDGEIDISSIEILRTKHPWLSREAIRVVRKMPRWLPGSQQGRNVPVYMKLPIRFSLLD